MAIKTFPTILARENSILWELTAQVISAGTTASGVMPLTRTDGGGLWKATLADVPLVTRDQVLAWRATTSYCEGGAQPIILPMCDLRHAPVLEFNGVPVFNLPDVPYSDNSLHSDDTPYAHGAVATIIAYADGPIPLRSTTVGLHVTQGGPLKGGQYFSIEHPAAGTRLYRIVDVDEATGTLCSIRPPLREALTATTTPVEFNHPACVMRLATPDAMDLILTMRKFGNPTVNFIEAFPPYPAGT